jgi:tetratricopeptide (TPR) repeat protein
VPNGNGVFWVIDYPESARPQVRDLLRGLARMEQTEHPVRVLLLSRVPMKEWHPVIDAAGAASISDSQEVCIGALATEGAGELFASAARRFAEHLEKPVPAVDPAAMAAWLEKDPEIHRLPLFVVAAALHAALLHPAELSLTGAQIVETLVRRERMRLDNAGANAGWGEKAASRLVGMATVAGGLDPAAVRRLAADPEVGVPAERTVDAVKALGWWDGSRLPAPSPDIVAAELLFSVLHDSPDRAPEWLWAALADVAPQEVDRLGRVTYDVGTLRGAGDHNRFASWLMATVEGRPERAARWRPIAEGRRLPLGVLPLAVALCTTLLDHRSADEADRAALLVSLSNCLSETGQFARAAEAAGEAVGIYSRVAERDLARFEPLLADSLTTLSVSLGDRDSAAALEASRSAVEIWRRLAAANPEYETELACALRAYSINLGEGAERDSQAGLVATRESVTLWRRLAETNPHYEADLAQALNTLAVDLFETGDKDGALQAVNESVEIWRRLARANPARYEPGLALTLNNLSWWLSSTGDHEEAIRMLPEAIRIYSRAAAAHPARYEPDLVRSLENLSTDLARMGNPAAAISAQREAIAIRRRLQTMTARRYRPGWADEMGLLARAQEELEDGLLTALMNAANTVAVLLVRGESPGGEPIYAYVGVRADRLKTFMEAQSRGLFYPEDFGVIIEAGHGEPSPEIKARMAEDYGFNHDAMLDIPDAEAADDITRQLVTQAHPEPEVADEEREPGE